MRLPVTEPTTRCRMVGVGQVDLAARPGLLGVVAEQNDLAAGVYAEVVAPGRVALDDVVGTA